MVQKALSDVLQPVFEEAFGLPAMLQNLYRLDVFVNVDADEIAPDICNHDNGEKIGHTFLNSNVRVFNVEAAALQSFEHRFDLPSLPVHIKCLLCTAIGDKNLELRPTFLVLDFRPRKVARLPVDIIDTCKMLTLTKFQISEKPMCLGFLSMPDDMEVLSYPDVVTYASGVQEGEPLASHKFPVGHQVGDAVLAGKGNESPNEFHSLFSVGIAALVHHLEHYRKGHALIDDAESKDVDVRAAELPVRPVHGQRVWALYWYEL